MKTFKNLQTIFSLALSFSSVLFFAFAFLLGTGTALGQFKDNVDEDGQELPKAGCQLGESVVQYYECGLKITARSTPVTNISAMIPIPVGWPEQKVRISEERHSPYARVSVKKMGKGGALMLVKIPSLPAGETAEIVTQFECESFTQKAPEDTSIFQKPEVKELPKSMKIYLRPSELIESKHKSIVKLSKQLGTDASNAWEEVEAVYDWVQANIKYENGNLKGALAALKDGTGDCEELSSLFIALCRAKGIPARIVWVPEHCYAEFYLTDENGNGYWFPCQPSGDKAFGEMPLQYVILQKGDNFSFPGDKKKYRYLPEQFKGNAKSTPNYQFVREIVHPNN